MPNSPTLTNEATVVEAENGTAAASAAKRYANQFPVGYFPPKFDLEENPDYLKADETWYVVGERRAGKTTLGTELLLKLRRRYPLVYVFTATPTNGYWQQYVPASKIIDVSEGFDDFAVEMLEKILRTNSKRYQDYKRHKLLTGRYKGNPLALIIFEDCVAAGDMRRLKALRVITLNGRHHGIACVIFSQDFKALLPSERDCQDRWFIFSPSSPSTHEAVRESLGFEAYEIAKRVWSKEHCLCVDKKKRTPPEIKYRWYEADMDYLKAATHKNLVLGNRRLWGDIKVEEQKLLYPCVDLPANATLEGEFNVELKDDENEEEMYGQELNIRPPEPEEPEQVTVGRSWHSISPVIF